MQTNFSVNAPLHAACGYLLVVVAFHILYCVDNHDFGFVFALGFFYDIFVI